MDLSGVDIDALRAEVRRRDLAAREARQAGFAAAFPCPECGAAPATISGEVTREDRVAKPAFRQVAAFGIPLDSGQYDVVAHEWTTTVECANGHTWSKAETKLHERP